jgi:hypothetical protein
VRQSPDEIKYTGKYAGAGDSLNDSMENMARERPPGGVNMVTDVPAAELRQAGFLRNEAADLPCQPNCNRVLFSLSKPKAVKYRCKLPASRRYSVEHSIDLHVLTHDTTTASEKHGGSYQNAKRPATATVGNHRRFRMKNDCTVKPTVPSPSLSSRRHYRLQPNWLMAGNIQS